MIFSIRDSLVRARGSLAPLGVAFVFSMGCELVLGDIPDNSRSSSGAGGDAGGSSSTSAGGSAGSTGTGGCCDCDGDGHKSIACGGDDCDDNNNNVYPGQMNFFKTARDGGTFDYNCDGKIEFEQPAFVDCAPVGGLICDTNTHGFLGKVHPACGTTANTGSCVVSMIGECKEQIEQPNVDVLCR